MGSINHHLSQEHELDVSRLTDELLAARLESGRLAAQEVLTLPAPRSTAAASTLEKVWLISTVGFCAAVTVELCRADVKQWLLRSGQIVSVSWICIRN